MESTGGGGGGMSVASRFDQRTSSKVTVSRPQSTGDEVGPSSSGGGGGIHGVTGSFTHPRRATRVYSDMSRRKSIQVPRDGTFIQIKSVFDIYKQVRVLVGMVSNVWSWTCSTTTLFRQVLPGLARVHVGNDIFTVPGYLLQELETISVPTKPATSSFLNHTSVTHPGVQDVQIRHATPYFSHVLLLLKLRWLLRLHSACCELDYKVCSLKNLILGIQYVVLQQHEEVECDSIFDTKVSRHIGSHLNLESVFDDIVDQLQRALGGAWRSFLEYVASCDPSRSLHISKMDSTITQPSVVSNDALAVVIDTIFLANFLRQSRQGSASRLRELFADLHMLGVAMPEVPPLRQAQYLRAWAKARGRPTLQDRSKVGKKDSEKLAQLDAVLLTASVELRLPEVIASADEVAESTANEAISAAFPEVSPKPVDFSTTGKAPGTAGPPAARVILEDKPQLAPVIFEAAVSCIHHHDTFPDGIRERLYGILNEEYGLTKDQLQKLAIGATQNIDGRRLSDSTLLSMEQREKARLRQFQANTHKDTMHLLVSPLVASPIERGNRAKYTFVPSPLERPPFASAFTSMDMTRSLPDLRGFTPSHTEGREPFKVPMSTGPLTMDPELKKLRSTGFFIKMPPLKGGS